MYVSVAIVRAFTEALVKRGLSPHALCDAARLEAVRLDDPTEMIHVGDYARVLDAAHELAADPALAVRVGEGAPSGGLHTVGYLLLNCRTMRDAIAQYVELATLIYDDARWQLRPDVMAAEDVFFAVNARSALALGQARGAALAIAGMARLRVFAYSPAVVKQAVTGRGRAPKLQVAEMVRALLGLKRLPRADAADALAVAVAHAQLGRKQRRA